MDIQFWVVCDSCGYEFLHRLNRPVFCPQCGGGYFIILEDRNPVS